MITLNGYAFIMPHSLAGLSFYPALAVLRFLALLIFMFFYVKQIVSECSGHL